MPRRPNTKVEEIWVNVTEASKITGYSRPHMQKLARENWNMSEKARHIRIVKRSNGYDMWLPDVVRYMEDLGYGPYGKRQKK
jgi:hypothetical protein